MADTYTGPKYVNSEIKEVAEEPIPFVQKVELEEINGDSNAFKKYGLIAVIFSIVFTFCLYRNHIKDPESYPNANCEISSLYVKNSLKRNGIGTKLMQHIIQKLQNQGKTQMILGCLKENYPSRAFYEKMGGKVLKIEKISFGNKEYEEDIYEYDISKM